MKIEAVQKKNLLHYGILVEAEKILEEAKELRDAIIFYENGEDTLEHLIEEFCDLDFVMEQVKLNYDIGKEDIVKVQRIKSDRQLERMEKDV